MKNPYFSLIQSVWNYGREWRTTIILYYVAFIMGQGIISLGPYIFGQAINVLQDFNSSKLYGLIFWLCLGIVPILLFWIFHGPARVAERWVALKIQQDFRLCIYQKLTHMPLQWHQDHHSGNILTRLNRSADALHRFAEYQYSYIETIVSFFTSVGFLLWISWPIGVISMLSSLFAMSIVLLYDRKLIPLYKAENEVDNHIGAVSFDYVSNITTVLTLRLGELTHSNLAKRMLSVWPFFKKEAILNECKWFSMSMFLSVIQTVVLVTYVVHTLRTEGMIQIGLVVMIFRYQHELSDVFYDLSSHYSEVVHMDTDVKGVDIILDDINRLGHSPKIKSATKEWGAIYIKNLTFCHQEKQDPIFNQINFTIKRGEKIALIGPSGSGKSTLLKILCGLYNPYDVELDIDRAHFKSLEPLRPLTTMIPQDPEIFENTIEFNITLDLSVDQSDIYRVIELAGFSDVLEKLPDGLKTDIREKGLNLSVGQKQRLALARGLFAARYSSLILMDEPTSSVDLATEKEILLNTIKFLPQSAMIISLHRLHLLPYFDSVIMLDAGKIVAQGSIVDLLNSPSPVQKLWMDYSSLPKQ